MKTSHLLRQAALCFLLPYAVFGQGCFHFSNIEANLNAPVFDANGQRLDGTNYLAALYGGLTADSLLPGAGLYGGPRYSTPFLTGVSAGYFRDGTVFWGVPPWTWMWLQVRAWDARLGGTYEEALAKGIGGYGESTTFYAQSGDLGDELGIPPSLLGLQSFSLRAVVPEPSTWALLALGGLALGWASRRQHILP